MWQLAHRETGLDRVHSPNLITAWKLRFPAISRWSLFSYTAVKKDRVLKEQLNHWERKSRPKRLFGKVNFSNRYRYRYIKTANEEKLFIYLVCCCMKCLKYYMISVYPRRNTNINFFIIVFNASSVFQNASLHLWHCFYQRFFLIIPMFFPLFNSGINRGITNWPIYLPLSTNLCSSLLSYVLFIDLNSWCSLRTSWWYFFSF